MASLNSFPFTLESRIETRVLLHSSYGSQFFECQLRKPLDSGAIVKLTQKSNHGGSCFRNVRSVSGYRRGGLWRRKYVRAKVDDSIDGQESEDAIQATIEKSKKVLAMQIELQQQTAERRKLVSSIKSSINDPFDEVSIKDGDKSSPMVDMGINRKNVDNVYPIVIASGKNMDLVASKVTSDETLALHVSSLGLRQEQIKIPSKPTNEDPSTKKEVTTRLPKEQPSQFYEISGGGKVKTTESLSQGKTSIPAKSPRKAKDITTLPDIRSETFKPSASKDEKDREELIFKDLSDQVNHNFGEDVNPPPLAGPNVMNVILVAAECAPFSKTGGLGDVAGALPKALARRGHRVMVIVPKYGDYAETQDSGIRKRYKVAGQDMEVCYFQTYIDGVDFVFIESAMFRHIENNIYAGNRLDVLRRMALFCMAAVEVPWHLPCGGVCYGDGNLVFIANDWHTALLPVYLKAYYRDNGLMTYTRSVLVIHNIAHQVSVEQPLHGQGCYIRISPHTTNLGFFFGVVIISYRKIFYEMFRPSLFIRAISFTDLQSNINGRGPVDDFTTVSLPPHYLDYFRMYDPVGGEHFNIFAAGLKTADRVVTVSHGYARELKTVEGGWGLHNIINENDWKFRGIVNGIDSKEWNPQFDVNLKSDGYTNYSLETLKPGKAQCKAALQRELGLPVRDDVPLVGFIGRLDHQKGIDLIAEAIPWMTGQDVQLVMLGMGRPDLEQMLKNFEGQYRDKIRGWVGFSVKTAHRITAGADILLMPSRFEPCGLNQLYAMSYGTVPVVHAVGGLRDTVQQFDPFNEQGVGWTFERAEANCLIDALGNCLYTYREYKQSWEGLQRRGMTQDFSWDHAAVNYEEVLVAAKYQW